MKTLKVGEEMEITYTGAMYMRYYMNKGDRKLFEIQMLRVSKLSHADFGHISFYFERLKPKNKRWPGRFAVSIRSDDLDILYKIVYPLHFAAWYFFSLSEKDLSDLMFFISCLIRFKNS